MQIDTIYFYYCMTMESDMHNYIIYPVGKLIIYAIQAKVKYTLSYCVLYNSYG
jgi:hypothetical protein